MTSKERILSVLNGQKPDYIPLTSWSFGFQPPKFLRWNNNGNEVTYWYTKRLEHIHTLPQPWSLEDDFKRVETWLSLGMDDMIDISVPWSMDPVVTYKDWIIPAGEKDGDPYYPVLARDYQTPAGNLQHRIRKTEDEGNGWPVQPSILPALEDYNVARGVKHLIASPADVEKAKYIFLPPNEEQKEWFQSRMESVKNFANEKGVMVQAWSAFGMDAAIWMAGVDNAVSMSMMDPDSFHKLMDQIAETDYARTELAVKNPGVDMVCQRGWYSSTDFWSPELFDEFIYPHLCHLTKLAHDHNKKFAYTMSTGVATLGPRLADAGVDLVYFIDPLMDSITLQKAAELFGNRMTVVGGISCLSLNESKETIRKKVKEAIDILGPTNRFILHPVDSLFPDTKWEGVEALIEAWKEFRMC
jgi:uroporphyrinogen-III decarboxylase